MRVGFHRRGSASEPTCLGAVREEKLIEPLYHLGRLPYSGTLTQLLDTPRRMQLFIVTRPKLRPVKSCRLIGGLALKNQRI
jgi:hypothetical protein